MRMRTTFLAFSTCASVALLGCTEIPIDETAPPPTGILEGSVDYIGPRPSCDFDPQSGVPTRVRGRAVLLLFVHGNAPPPAGTATTPESLLVIDGSSFFSDLAADCLPAAPTPEELAQVLKRSASVSWPEIRLGEGGREVSYMVQGFYDRDEDFHPFFAATRSTTAQDIAGAAVEDPFAATPVLSRFTFGSADTNPAGQIVGGLSVTLAAPVNTEPPVFHFVGDPLASDQPFVLSPDPALLEESLRRLTNASLELYDDLAAPEGVELLEALDAAKLSYSLAGDPAYGFYVRALDFDGDAAPDPHPVLGALAYDWLSPVVMLQRLRSRLEAQVGIPDVVMVPALPAYTTAEGAPVTAGQVSASTMPIVLPPVAAIVTNSRAAVCQIATLPPASTAFLYADQLADCQELPTGRYAVNVFHGVTGGAFIASATSATGFEIAGGQHSGQSWTIPNELGDPAQLPPEGAPPTAPPEPDCSGAARCADSQGIRTAFLVHDPDTSSTLSRTSGDAACLNGADLFDPNATVPYTFADFNVSAVQAFIDADPTLDTVEQVRDLCCDPIVHLCGLPLCDYVPAAGDDTRMVRGTPTSVTRVRHTDGSERLVPNCIPFYMPTPCCGGG